MNLLFATKLIVSLPVENMTNPDLGSWASAKIAQLHGLTEFPPIRGQSNRLLSTAKPVEWIVAHPTTVLNKDQMETLETAIARLIDGEPLAYITGRQSFLDWILS